MAAVMSLHYRRILLTLALAVSVAAAVWIGGADEPAEPAAAARTERPARKGPEAVPPRRDVAPAALTEARNFPAAGIDPMAPKSWYVPPPPPPPARPTAPPLPFAFGGRLMEEGRTRIFLSEQNRNRVVEAGDVIDNLWRVDEIGATRIAFRYLPLDELKYLPTDGAR